MTKDTRAFRRRLVLTVGVSTVLALLCAVLNSGIVGGFPPKLRLNHMLVGAATAHIYVDLPSPTPSLVDRQASPPQDVQTMTNRAELLGRILASDPVLTRIEARCQIPADQLSGQGETTANVPISLTEPDSERRASEIAASDAMYRLDVQARRLLPIIDVYTQGPTVAGATCVGNAAVPALTDYLRSLASQQHQPLNKLTRLEALGPAQGGVANAGTTVEVALLTFITVFGLAFAVLFGLLAYLRRPRASDAPQLAPVRPEAPVATDAGDSWPHTNRVLPWMFAGFLAVIWLTPFNNIELKVSLPIELRLDRMILPFLVIVWLLALSAGSRFAPRLRLTWVHIALAGMLACAFISVVTDASYLNHSLKLSLSFKKLPLMVSYASLFVIAASVVRVAEVRPFMTYTLVLAMIVAFGMIWEYRMKVNLFWDLSGKLLPPIFRLDGDSAGDVVDTMGRRLVHGPAEVPLEAVAMLAMALAIAIVRALHSENWRQRLIYSVCVCVLFAAMLATYRKSALVVPVSVVIALAFFRRRELIRLAPLGIVTIVVVTAVAPGTIGGTVREFTRPDAATLPTVNDRTSDYDAIRPDVFSHLALGRGWGSYNHESYRILDSEILERLIETGVVGLIAFLLLGISVIAAGRKVIARGDPATSQLALIGALVAVAFLVAATLFDELAFPHAAYIFLYMAGLATVVMPKVSFARAARRRPLADTLPPLEFNDAEPARVVEATPVLTR